MQLRLTLSHSIAARTAAAHLRLGGVAPRLLRSLCIRGWAVRGSDLRSRTASRLVLRCCGASASGGVAPNLLLSLSTQRGGGALLRLSPRTSLRLVPLRRGRAAWRPDSRPRSTGEGGRRAAPTYALAQRRGSRGYGASAVGRHSARRLLSLCTRGGRRATPTCDGWRASPTYALEQHRGSCCGASAVGRRGAQLVPSLCTRGWAACDARFNSFVSSLVLLLQPLVFRVVSLSLTLNPSQDQSLVPSFVPSLVPLQPLVPSLSLSLNPSQDQSLVPSSFFRSVSLLPLQPLVPSSFSKSFQDQSLVPSGGAWS